MQREKADRGRKRRPCVKSPVSKITLQLQRADNYREVTPVWAWLAPPPPPLALPHSAGLTTKKLGPLVPFGQNLFTNSHSGPNCMMVAAATHDSQRDEATARGESSAEEEEEEERRDEGCVCQEHSLGSAALSTAPCQCHYVGVRSGAVSAQTDVTHTFRHLSEGHPRLTPGERQVLTR